MHSTFAAVSNQLSAISSQLSAINDRALTSVDAPQWELNGRRHTTDR